VRRHRPDPRFLVIPASCRIRRGTAARMHPLEAGRGSIRPRLRPFVLQPTIRGSQPPWRPSRSSRRRHVRGTGKGAARAVRREGRVPGVIYGDDKPPLAISLDHADIRRRSMPAISSRRSTRSRWRDKTPGDTARLPARPACAISRSTWISCGLGAGAQIRVRIPIHVRNADSRPA